MPSLAQMAESLGELVRVERSRMRDWEEMTYRQGLSPGADVSFAGVRILVERTAKAQALLHRLAPHEAAFYAWLEQRAPQAAQSVAATG